MMLFEMKKTFKNRKNEDLFLKLPDFKLDLSIQGQNVIVHNKKKLLKTK